MAKIIIKSAIYSIVTKELDTDNYKGTLQLMDDIVRAIRRADWFEEKDEPTNSAAH